MTHPHTQTPEALAQALGSNREAAGASYPLAAEPVAYTLTDGGEKKALHPPAIP